MKKISILSLHLGYGGIEKAVVNLANSLSNKYKVEIACTYKLFDEPGFKLNSNVNVKYLIPDMKPNRDEIKNSIKKLKFFSLIKELFYALKVLKLRKSTMINYLKKCDSDIIISTRDIFNEWLGEYGHCKVKIGWEHNHYHGNMKYAKEIIKSVKNLDYFVLVSNDLNNFYSKNVNCKCVFIPNSINDIPKEYSKLNNKRLISVGRLSPEKGYVDLLNLFLKLHNKDSEYSLDIVGAGVLMPELENFILDNNLNDCVKLHGFQSTEYINKLLFNSSIYLMSSYTESFGIVLLEAMSCGVPCIAFDSAEGAREVIEDGKNGYLISNRSFDNMIEKIEYLIDNNNVRKKMGEYARKSVEKYTSDSVIKQWYKIIEESDIDE